MTWAVLKGNWFSFIQWFIGEEHRTVPSRNYYISWNLGSNKSKRPRWGNGSGKMHRCKVMFERESAIWMKKLKDKNELVMTLFWGDGGFIS